MPTTGNEKYVIDTLNSMSITEARQAIASGQFGSIGRPDRAFASEYLSSKESEERDKREAESLSISRKALAASEDANELARDANNLALDSNKFTRREVLKDRIIAIVAVIIAAIAARDDIKWLISWLINKLTTS